jgi:hypothetical protein
MRPNGTDAEHAGAGDNGADGAGHARVARLVHHARRDEDEVTRSQHDPVLELVAVPQLDRAFQHVDGRLEAHVRVRTRSSTRRELDEIHADAGRARCASGHTGERRHTLTCHRRLVWPDADDSRLGRRLGL